MPFLSRLNFSRCAGFPGAGAERTSGELKSPPFVGLKRRAVRGPGSPTWAVKSSRNAGWGHLGATQHPETAADAASTERPETAASRRRSDRLYLCRYGLIERPLDH